MLIRQRNAARRRERTADAHIPYRAHVAKSVIRTEAGDYLQAIRLGGSSFECADDEQLNRWHERLNILWRNIAAPNVTLWTHLIRRRADLSWTPGATEVQGSGFVSHLVSKYRQRLAVESLMVNELYLAVLYRPVRERAVSMVSAAFSKVSARQSSLELHDAIEASDKLLQTIMACLAEYDPEPLGSYARDERIYSTLYNYLSLLVNAEACTSPVPYGPLHTGMATTRLLFGNEVIEYRASSATRLGAMLGIKEYSTPSVVGMFDGLLSAPFSHILTQSFGFLSKAAGQGLLQRQYLRMVNAGDFAVTQAEELKGALDALAGNEFVLGDHHLSLQVLVDVPGGEAVAHSLKSLDARLAVARNVIADNGMTVAREDLGLEAAFWAQLPGNYSLRPRKAVISSRNFCAMAPFHNYPAGRATGNHWGDAQTVLMTSARSPYYFSLHASDPKVSDGGLRKDTGHTFICGPTGSGKTVLIGFLVAMLARQGTTQIVFDKDRGLEILVRALGGTYLAIAGGVPSGFNPLQLPPTAANTEFLKLWLGTLVRTDSTRTLNVREQADLEQALSGVLCLDPKARRLSRLIEFLDPTDQGGAYARLTPWCEATGGDYAWVFDNPVDKVANILVPKPDCPAVIGFDVTEFIGNEKVRPAITLYLFHLVRRLIDGRRLVCWMDEFWRLLADSAFEQFAKDGPKTWRKLNGVMCLATQSASDVLDSPISRTIVEQTPTKIFFPNPNAVEDEYVRGFGLTRREFTLVRDRIDVGSGKFLVKQGQASVVCQLDLKGFDGELAVISGRAHHVERVHRIMAATGTDAAAWLPKFLDGESGSALQNAE